MNIDAVFDAVKFTTYKATESNPDNHQKSDKLNFFEEFLHTPIIKLSQFMDRAKQAVQNNSDLSQDFTQESVEEPSQKNQTSNKTATMTLAGYEVPKSWIEASWKQECGTEFGKLDEKHRKGIVCRDNNGKADNKKNAKTYGPGLLYNPETGKLMQDSEPSGGYTTQELTRLFLKTIEKHLEIGKKAGCKTWNQAIAYAGISANFGSNHQVIKTLNQLIQSNTPDKKIFNFIAHASDSQRNSFPGLIKRRMWEARQWIGDVDLEGSDSKKNLQMVQNLNPGTKKKKQGGIIENNYPKYQYGGELEISRFSNLLKEKTNYLDEEIYNRLINPNDINIYNMLDIFSQDQLNEAHRIVSDRIQEIYNDVEENGLNAIPVSVQQQVQKLVNKQKIIENSKPNKLHDMIKGNMFQIRELEKKLKTSIPEEREMISFQLKDEYYKLNQLKKLLDTNVRASRNNFVN